MNRKFLYALVAAMVGALALTGLGCEMCCNSSQGAGSMVIADPATNRSHRATFNYRVSCTGSYAPDAPRTVSGKFQYQDHGAWTNAEGIQYNVSVEAAIDNVVSTEQVYFLAANDDYYDFLSIPSPGTAEAGVFCSSAYPNMVIFKGTYKPWHQPGDAGTVYVMVMDNGKGGPSSGDRFEILLDGGEFRGYRKRGVIAGGNLRTN
ncbi:MAG: hypothetical protein ACM3NF_08580 [Gemmatimonadota bacterium]